MFHDKEKVDLGDWGVGVLGVFKEECQFKTLSIKHVCKPIKSDPT